MSRWLQRRHAHRTHTAQVSLTPLVDTALTLLVVFMVTAPVAQRAISVELPEVTQGDHQALHTNDRRVIVTLDQRGNISLDGISITKTELAQKVEDRMQQSVDGTVYLRVDKRTQAGEVISLLADIRSLNGVKCVAFDIDSHEHHTL